MAKPSPKSCTLSKAAPKWLVAGALVVVALMAGLLAFMLVRRAMKRGHGGHVDRFETLAVDPKAELVFMHMTNCTWCEKFMPAWDAFEEKYADKLFKMGVKLAKHEKSEPEAEPYLKQVKGFPTVLLAKNGPDSSDDEMIVYDGERTPEALLEFVEKQMESFVSKEAEGDVDADVEQSEGFVNIAKAVGASKDAAQKALVKKHNKSVSKIGLKTPA